MISKSKIFILALAGLFFQCTQENKKQKEARISTDEAGKYSISLFGQTMIVNAQEGARIISFSQNGKEIIGPGGSTFWTSPQDDWGWPPIKAHHDEAYTATVSDNKLELVSNVDDKLGVEIKKVITANASDTSFTVAYTITNKSEKELKVAPWENTRTNKSGITFYPKGDSTFQGNPIFGTLGMKEINGINWFAFDSSRIGDGKNMAKLYADGKEGWIANADNNMLLIKKFKDISIAEQPAGEGEIEIFADLENPFVEMEQQGALEILAPGKSLTWEVKWFLRELPENVKTNEGNEELVNIVRKTIK